MLPTLFDEASGFGISFLAGVCAGGAVMLLTRIFGAFTPRGAAPRKIPAVLAVLDIIFGALFGTIYFIVMFIYNGAQLRLYHYIGVALGAAASMYVGRRLHAGRKKE